MKQQSALAKAVGFWLGVNVVLGIGVYVASRPALPQPLVWHEITLANGVVLRKTADGFEVDGKKVKDPWLQGVTQILHWGCDAVFPEAEFAFERHNPKTFKIDDYQYVISNHNAYAQGHYVHHAGEVYVCDERLKSLVNTPLEHLVE